MKATSKTEVPNKKLSRPIRVPRWMAFFLGLVAVLGVYPIIVGVLPLGLSGWTESGPALWNLLGLISVAAGTAGLLWVFSVLLAQLFKLPEPVALEETTSVLLTHGLFAIVSVILWAVTHVFTVPREERALETRFGEAYRAYKRRAPRWLGLTAPREG